MNRYLREKGVKSIFLVCGNSYRHLAIKDYFDTLHDKGVKLTFFSNFQPNPLYGSVVEGVKCFRDSKADTIIAVGGGSAMDVAKCIKLFSNMDNDKNYLEQTIVPNSVRLIAVPTTAGTGSEATRFAVIYYNGNKQSVSDYSCIPEAVLFDASTLETLPLYQKKSAMLDAMCHAMESFWSVNSNDISKEYSRVALAGILKNMDSYLLNNSEGNAAMMQAAYRAGQAINITQTTAGHAMCYKLTNLYGIAHGHAAALVNAKLFPYMIDHIDLCIDPRGELYLISTFKELAKAMGCKNEMDAAKRLQMIFGNLQLSVPEAKEEDFEILKTSVNSERLKNNPIQLTKDSIEFLYRQILAK
jgi:alcohol dehydrogenase class IV